MHVEPYTVCHGWDPRPKNAKKDKERNPGDETREDKGDCLMRKGLGKWQIGDVTWIFFHNEAGNFPEDFAAKAVQGEELISFIPKEGRVVVLGDLNLKEKRPEDMKILRHILTKTGLTVEAHDGADIIMTRGVEIDQIKLIPLDKVLTDHNGFTGRVRRVQYKDIAQDNAPEVGHVATLDQDKRIAGRSPGR